MYHRKMKIIYHCDKIQLKLIHRRVNYLLDYNSTILMDLLYRFFEKNNVPYYIDDKILSLYQEKYIYKFPLSKEKLESIILCN